MSIFCTTTFCSPPRLAMMAAALRCVQQRPLLTGIALAGGKGVCADINGQMIGGALHAGDYNARQTVAFGLWNALYCGAGVYAMYSFAFPRYWPLTLMNGARHPAAMQRTVGMVLFDNLIATPCICLPTYYLCALALENAFDTLMHNPQAVASAAMRRYKDEARETIGLSLALWIPIHTVTFSIIPPKLRVHWTACCSFLTLTCMSLLQTTLDGRRVRNRST